MTAYPLAALSSLRVEEQAAREKELALAIGRADASQLAVERAQAALAQHRAATERVRDDERKRDEAGRAAQEALFLGDWLRRRKAEEAQLVAGHAEALAARKRCEEEVTRAREALAAARAEVEALMKHRQKWDQKEQRVQERREEAEQDDRRLKRPERGTAD